MLFSNPAHKGLTASRPWAQRSWLVASVVAVFFGEVLFVTGVIRERGIFDYVALDYRGSRSAGEAIREYGLEAPYDASLLEDSQRRMYDRYVRASEASGTLPFGVVPAPYPAPFTLAFVPSTWLSPVSGFVAWTLFHALVLVLYQLRLARAFGLENPWWLIVAVLISPPALIQLLMGQISVWLMVFFGEAMIAFKNRKEFRAGIWLGLMMVKPQSLVLVVPCLVVFGQWSALFGIGVAGVGLVAPTLIGGCGWMTAYARGLIGFFNATGTVLNTFPTSMTTWRAFGLNASRIVPTGLAWTVAVCGMAATGVVGLLCGRVAWARGNGQQLAWASAWLGLAAATNAFAWHAHVHQSLMLVPPLYWIIGIRPGFQKPVEAVCLGLAAVFVGAAMATTVGRAHDILGMLMLIVLVAMTIVGCAASRSLMKISGSTGPSGRATSQRESDRPQR